MAAVDLNQVQFWVPPSNPSLHKQRTTLLKSKGSSQNQPAPLHSKNQGDSFITGAQGCDDGIDDDFPSIEEILGLTSHQGISIGGYRNTEAALQDLDRPALDTNGSHIGPKQSRLDNGTGDGQGTQDRPVILEDDELDTPDLEAPAVSASVDAGADFAFELSKPIDLPNHTAWYDVKAGRYVGKELLPGLEPEQEGLAASSPDTPDPDYSHYRYHSPGPSHDRTGQYNDDGNTQSTVEDLAPHYLPKPLDGDGGGNSGENVGKQDHSEEEPQEQLQLQQQEVAVQAMRQDDHDDDDDGEQRGEKRRHQDGIEQIRTNVYHSKNSGHSNNTSNEDEDPRPAKRRKSLLRHPRCLTPPNEDTDGSESPRPPKQHQPSSNSELISKHDLQRSHKRLTTPVQTQLEQPSSMLHSDRRQSKIHPTSVGVEESMLNASAEYQEWTMSGVFKRVIVGDEVRYGMEFSLEGSHGLMCAEHTVAHDSTIGRDSQPGTSWEIRRITGMREVDGVQEFRIAWAQTWTPESELGGARELVDEFKARLSVRHGKKSGQDKTNVTDERPAKRRRGRPRKEV